MMVGVVVVGGSYIEECSFPRSVVYRGSGMRAASVLAGLGNATTLNTVAGPVLSDEFSEICRRKGIVRQTSKSGSDIWFRYRHPLSKPDIYPALSPSMPDRVPINAECVLVFGMIEGRPQVKAKRVIYDPQDGYRAKHFAVNGSTADELVVLASLSEGRALTGKTSADEIATELLTQPSCVATVIKCGPHGALVATAEMRKWVSAFPSSRVWKIGSGDVFSAAFAHKWFVEGASALEAAWFASRMVAEYVSTRMEVFKDDRLEVIRAEANKAASRPANQAVSLPDATVYLAGPFFTTAQQWLVDEARFALRDLGFKVFSPIHEVGEGTPYEVAPADLYGLENSQLVFALVDGLDAGTIFEIGYARSRDIPVVCLAESVDPKALTMLLGSGCEVQDDFSTSIYAACWQLMSYV